MICDVFPLVFNIFLERAVINHHHKSQHEKSTIETQRREVFLEPHQNMHIWLDFEDDLKS